MTPEQIKHLQHEMREAIHLARAIHYPEQEFYHLDKSCPLLNQRNMKHAVHGTSDKKICILCANWLAGQLKNPTKEKALEWKMERPKNERISGVNP